MTEKIVVDQIDQDVDQKLNQEIESSDDSVSINAVKNTENKDEKEIVKSITEEGIENINEIIDYFHSSIDSYLTQIGKKMDPNSIRLNVSLAANGAIDKSFCDKVVQNVLKLTENLAYEIIGEFSELKDKLSLEQGVVIKGKAFKFYNDVNMPQPYLDKAGDIIPLDLDNAHLLTAFGQELIMIRRHLLNTVYSRINLLDKMIDDRINHSLIFCK